MDINQKLVAGKMFVNVAGTNVEHYVIGVDGGNQVVGMTGIVGRGDDAESIDDGLRLAAAWNLVRGMPTKALLELQKADAQLADADRFSWLVGTILEQIDPRFAGKTIEDVRKLIDGAKLNWD